MSVNFSQLDNGLRILSDRMDHVETVTVSIWVDVGARYEPRHLNGASHLLEHMAFKGTHRRSARDLAIDIENVGGYLNAFTSREHTNYYARLMKDDLALAVDILADITRNPLFREEELTREKDVILQEIGQSRDTPDDHIFDLLQATAFPEQPLGRSIMGSMESVARLRTGLLQDFMKNHYRGESMVLTAAGAVDHDTLAGLAEKYFGDLPARRNKSYEPARYEGGDVRLNRHLEQLHIACAFPGVSYHDDGYYTMQVYNTILGGGMSSRLFQEVRENRGLAYSVYSYASSHDDCGLLGLYAGTSPPAAANLLPVIADEMKKLADGVEEEELSRAKAQLKTGLVMALEGTAARAEQLGRQMLVLGRTVPVAELIEKVEAITSGDIAGMAGRMLEGRLSLAAIGDGRELPGFEVAEALFRLT